MTAWTSPRISPKLTDRQHGIGRRSARATSAASIARVVAMSNRCLGDAVSHAGPGFAGASVAVIGSILQVDGTFV